MNQSFQIVQKIEAEANKHSSNRNATPSMQERGNIIPQQPTPAVLDIAPANIVAQSVGGIVDQKIGQIEEGREREAKANMAPNSQQLPRSISHTDSFLSFSSLDSGASGLLTSVMKIRVGGWSTPSQQKQQQDVSAAATLAAKALQNPALSESALLLLRSLRMTANIERAPRSIMEQNEAATRQGGSAQVVYGSIPSTEPNFINHEEKVNVLRRLYAGRTRNKVGTSDNDNDDHSDEMVEQEQATNATCMETIEESSRDGGISSLEGELRKMMATKQAAKVRKGNR